MYIDNLEFTVLEVRQVENLLNSAEYSLRNSWSAVIFLLTEHDTNGSISTSIKDTIRAIDFINTILE